MTKQRDTENVNDFITRYRELVSQMVDRIPEEEQLGMIVKNFEPEIWSDMGHQYFEWYKAPMHVANAIKEELAQVAEANKAFFQYKKIIPTVNQVWSYQNSSPHQQPSFRYPQEQGSKKLSSRTKNRHFSHLPTSLIQILATLQAEGIL